MGNGLRGMGEKAAPRKLRAGLAGCGERMRAGGGGGPCGGEKGRRVSAGAGRGEALLRRAALMMLRARSACSWRLGGRASVSDRSGETERSLHEGDIGGGGGSGGGLLMLLPRPGSHGPGLTQPSRLLGGREAAGVQGGDVGRLSGRSWGESREDGEGLVSGPPESGFWKGWSMVVHRSEIGKEPNKVK
jgi:hypothetical protein